VHADTYHLQGVGLGVFHGSPQCIAVQHLVIDTGVGGQYEDIGKGIAIQNLDDRKGRAGGAATVSWLSGVASASTRSISVAESRVFSGTAVTPSQAHA
jgi:hypothetical protein